MNVLIRAASAVLAPAAVAAGVLTAGPASAGTVPRCHTAQLGLSVALNGSAAGSTYYRVMLTNETGRTCSLHGYPGVSFLGAEGQRLGFPASRDQSYPPSRVVLRPGVTGTAVLTIGSTANYPPNACKPARTSYIRVYPPNAYKSITHHFRTRVCMGRHNVEVTPVSGVSG